MIIYYLFHIRDLDQISVNTVFFSRWNEHSSFMVEF